MHAEDFSGDKLVNLACKLRVDFAREAIVDALVFDDKQAAKHLALGWEHQKNYIVYLWHLRAHYFRDREKGVEYIEFLFPELEDVVLPRLKLVKCWLDKPASH
jgi:hypothetical protein